MEAEGVRDGQRRPETLNVGVGARHLRWPLPDQPTCDELMSTFYSQSEGSVPSRMEMLRRRPTRATVTLPWSLNQKLLKRADEEGRSLSNLIATLLERSMS